MFVHKLLFLWHNLGVTSPASPLPRVPMTTSPPQRQPQRCQRPLAPFRTLPGTTRFGEGGLPTQPLSIEILQNYDKIILFLIWLKDY